MAPGSIRLVDVVGSESVVVAGLDEVVASSDGGVRWRNITPAQWANTVLVSHVVDVESFGADRIWLEPVGDFRFDFVAYTSDSGAKWKIGRLPAGAVFSGSPLSFWTGSTGRAIGELNGGASRVYQTDNGGVSWTRVVGATPGPFGGPVRFTSARDGWTWNGKGSIYRTRDGGRSWQRVGLPAPPGFRIVAEPPVRAAEPLIFDKRSLVVVTPLRSDSGGGRTAFYTSDDGGASWHAQLAPSAAGDGTAPFLGGGTSVGYAAGPSDWFVLNRRELFSTTDAGRSWHRADVRTPRGMSIDEIDGLTSTLGWARALGPTIYRRTPSGSTVPSFPTYLLRTTDGGRNWSRVNFGP